MSQTIAQTLEYISSSNAEPGWMREKRRAAFDLFQELPLETAPDSPLLKHYTSFRDFDLDSLIAGIGKEPGLEIRGGKEATAQGATVSLLSQALHDHEVLLKQYMLTQCVTPNESKLVALNAALWQNGVLIHLPKNTVLKSPLHILHTGTEKGQAHLMHTLVVAEEGSGCTILEDFQNGHSPAPQLNANITELLLHPGSQVHFSQYQNWNAGAYVHSMNRAVLEKDASIGMNAVLFGGKTCMEMFETLLKGEGARAINQGIYLGNQQQHFDISANVRHLVPNTYGHVEHRGVLKDQADSIFRGLLRVTEKSYGTESFVGGHALLLSKEARANSVPSLRIDNNDVKTKHAATVSQVDEAQMFYLMNRGLSRAAAERMIIQGYFDPVLKALPFPQIQEQAQGVIDERIG